MTPAPRELLAAKTREVIEQHDQWDSPHCFQILGRDGACRSYAAIAPDVHPDQYPALMSGLAGKRLEEHPDDPAYAYLLQIEGWGVADPGPDAAQEERRQFEADRRGRTFHARPDRIETVTAWCADIHGRLWSAARVRGDEGIRECFYPPGSRMAGGQFVRAILAVALTTGVMAWGLPDLPDLPDPRDGS